MIARRKLCLSLCAAAFPVSRLRAQEEPVFTALAQDVPIDTAVTSGQRPVPGLRAGDFVLQEGGRPQPIRAVTTEELPLDLVLIVPTVPWEIEGIGEGSRKRLLNAAANILRLTRAEDRAAILLHTSPPRIELPFTNDREAMAAALRRIGILKPASGFSERVAFESAIRMLADLSPAPARRRLIVRLGIFDGAVEYADDPVIRRLWSENIVFSNVETLHPGSGLAAIGTGERALEPSGPMYRLANPNHIANATGGDALRFLDPQNPIDLVTPIRQRYTLWFTQPESLEPGHPRTLAVDVSPEVRRRYPDAMVRAREGYITR